ncbi:MAG: DUF721 domain-containing protein [Cyanobacteriota bacterium]|nr:DUF721 domain-containing protein [Cyanobacteriota bacterium]
MEQPGANQTRRIGSISVLVPAARSPAEPVARCLDALQNDWARNGAMAALWRAWPRIAGPQLAPHCRPLRFQAGLLTVGAPPGPWLQALQYNRHQLLGALRGAGFAVRDLRLEQHHPRLAATPGGASEAEVWALHPSRVDVHGLGSCPACGAPAPAGEISLWGHCGFCRRITLASP